VHPAGINNAHITRKRVAKIAGGICLLLALVGEHVLRPRIEPSIPLRNLISHNYTSLRAQQEYFYLATLEDYHRLAALLFPERYVRQRAAIDSLVEVRRDATLNRYGTALFGSALSLTGKLPLGYYNATPFTGESTDDIIEKYHASLEEWQQDQLDHQAAVRTWMPLLDLSVIVFQIGGALVLILADYLAERVD